MPKLVKNRLIWWAVGVVVYLAWRYSNMRPPVEPAHILYRRELMNNLTSLMGRTVGMETHPQFYADWSLTEEVQFNNRLVAPEAISSLVRALDAEHRDRPWEVSTVWGRLIAITGREPEETVLDWSRL